MFLLKTYTNVILKQLPAKFEINETNLQNNGYSPVGIPLTNVYFHIKF